MDYELAINSAPNSIPGGTGILLIHPSTGETDRIDTYFLKTDTDRLLVISTRTTAREVQQKLEYYDVDESKADILDTLSVERGYSRRTSDHVHYVSAPDDLDGIIKITRQFLDEHEGKRRISLDSVTEMAYYADEDKALTAVEELLALLEEYDAVGLFHLSEEVHSDADVAAFKDLFDGIIYLEADGTIETDF